MIYVSDINYEKILSEELLVDLPELYKLRLVVESNIWHEESVFDHTLKILSLYERLDLMDHNNDMLVFSSQKILSGDINGISKKDLFKLVILFHDVAKFDTLVSDEHGFTRCPGHEELGYLQSKLILERFKISSSCRDYVLKIIKYHGIPHVVFDDISTAEALLGEKSKNFLDIYPDILLFCLLDTMASDLEVKDFSNYQNRIHLYKKILSSLI